MVEGNTTAASDAVDIPGAYKRIFDKREEQLENYRLFLKTLPETYTNKCVDEMSKIGIHLDVPTGHLSYTEKFEKLNLCYNLCYIRHGQTDANTEPRCFQGPVDCKRNQLNSVGKQQAEDAATLMEKEMEKGFDVDLIVTSPQDRARHTALCFAKAHPSIPFLVDPKATEMAFGEVENTPVLDLDPAAILHSTYVQQNALAKANPMKTENGETHPAENFVEVLLRVKSLLLQIDEQMKIVAAQKRRSPNVLLYAHYLTGSAVRTLLGKSTLQGESHITFNSKFVKLPNATPMYLNLLSEVPPQ